jgi:hypothetical protein
MSFKKLIIPKEDLPDINFLTQEYQVRFRVTTEDRNRFSAWTPIFGVNPELDFTTTGEVLIEKHTGYSTVVWNPVSLQKDGEDIGELESYDLWVRWGTEESDGEWEYKERINSTSINVLKPTSPAGIDTLSVELYYPGRPRLRKATYDIYQSNGAGNVNLATDTITISTVNVLKTGYKILYESTNALTGLTSGNNYYVRMVSSDQFTLHLTEQDALDNTNKVDITAHKNSVGFFTWEDCTVCDYLLYAKYNFSPV